MRLSIWKDLAILIAIFALIWLAFSYVSFDFMESDSEDYFSIEKEAELADTMLEYALVEYEIEEDSTMNANLQVISSRLMESLDSSSYDYTFRIVKSEQVNAFATLGGNIFVFTGLIDFVHSPEELALVLAHEIGHVEERHVVDKLVQHLGLSALFAIITGGDPVLVSQISQLLMGAAFDRKKERAADEFAYDLALKCNLNPHRIAQFFIRTLDKKQALLKNLEILMSHPHSTSRVQKAAEVKLPDDFVEIPFEINWVRGSELEIAD